ncbi:alpha/beta fold hydrolase [Bradyrhizobium canariense]|uniref:alpha/beta fold hydrolase n=1 Tax=Bradyrhizobium canariense TaxID=255045 RepID=UPI001B89EA73|nr:alpha/beta hydrolase [Bradyrhizobium canariense]MBR0954937.1 alpha/beta hydrolase [Bradyrhizobium canariense]
MTRAVLGCVGIAMGLVLHLTITSAAEGPSRHVVDVGGARIEIIAEGQGPLIVLLPSTGRGPDDFDVLAGGLAQAGFRVLRPQPRGIGGSVGPMTGVSFHDFAKDIAGIIRHEGGGPAVIAGHAYGNWIARTMASDHPQLVRGVVLMAAGAKTWPRELSDAITTINDRSQPRALRLKALELAFFAPGNDASPWLEGWYKDVTESQRAAGLNTKRESWWAGGMAPILDLQAADDPFRPRDTTDELKNDFGDRVSVVVLPNASHALPCEQPAAVVQAIVAWARSH